MSAHQKTETKSLGVIDDSKLNFGSHIDFIVAKRNSKPFSMKQLRNMGMNPSSLNIVSSD